MRAWVWYSRSMSSSINVFQPDYFEKTQQAHTPYDLVRWIWDKPPAFNPGESSGYSNANFTLLAYIIDGYLFVPGQQSVLLRLSDQIFVHRAHWFRVIFDWNDDGQVTGMRYGQFKAKKESGN